MEINRNAPGPISIRLSREELRIMKDALNEVCHGIDVPEFQTRMGVELEEVEALLKQITTFLKGDSMP